MAQKKVTRTWLGDAWLEALGIVFQRRTNIEAETLIQTDAIKNFKIDSPTVSANVRGIYKKYYDTQVSFPEFREDEINSILDIINENPLILSALLNHELPQDLYFKLQEKNIDIFPFEYLYITSKCDCYEVDDFCKHKLAILHKLATEIDRDPFLIFKLRGCDLLSLIGFHDDVDVIKTSDEVFAIEDSELKSGDFVDFSTVPDLYDEIFFLLKDDPIFYKKNFKNILSMIYKALPRFIKKNIISYTRQNKINSYNPFIDVGDDKVFKGRDENYTRWLDNVFLKRWDMPNTWSQFRIHINKDYKLSNINVNNQKYIKDSLSFDYLVKFFTELSESQIIKFNPDIQFLNLIYQFSLELVKNHAFIPQLFQSGDFYNIRWIPAIFDNNISKIIDSLSANCPDNLVKFKNKKLSKKSQVIASISLFINGILDLYFENSATKRIKSEFGEEIFKLFFFDGIKLKDNLSDIKIVNQWLSKFNFNTTFHDLYFVIDEVNDVFKLDICVNDNLDSVRDVINNSEDIKLKIELLKQLYLIIEIFPEFRVAFEKNEDITLDVTEFSEFFLNTLPLFKIMGIKIILPKSLNNQFKPHIVLNIKSNSNTQSFISLKDITEFDWKVQIGNNNYDLDEFKQIAQDSKDFVKFNNNYVMLDEKEVKSLIRKMDKLPNNLNENELMQSILAGEFRDVQVNIDDKLAQLVKNITGYKEVSIPDSVTADLRPYQEVAFSWLVQNIKMGFGSILADDMGLGKTLEVLTTIQYFKDEGLIENDKILIVAPTGLLTNWQKEIEKFTPNLTSYIYHGSNREFPQDDFDICLTSFGIIRRDAREFKNKNWFLLVVDEAQNIKNPQSKQTKAIKSIKSKHRIAMSGTPVENRLSDYWSIFDFINKGYLTSLKKFNKNFIVPIEKEQNKNVLDNFKKITSPFILRRVKSDKNIVEDLPDKFVSDVYCNLSQKQIGLYKETLEDTMEEIALNDGIQRKGLILNLISSLKQICNHPAQFSKSNKYSIEESGKLETLISTVDNILDSNEKVLIFTQYRQMGNIIKDTLEKTFKTKVLFLHGGIKRDLRDEIIYEFQTNSQIKIFIITLKTGGTGLNLTSANNVIHYDLWWNPAVENQATDRAYRIGQSDNVRVYRFITSGTFEEKINDIIMQKEDLANSTIGNGETFITEMDNAELKELMMLR